MIFDSFSRSITRSYYRNSVGALLVYDITKRCTFEHIEDWYEEAKMHIEPHRAVFILVGTKCDIESNREVTTEEGKQFAEFHGLKFLETSSKSGQNVEEAFLSVTRDIHSMLETGNLKMKEGWDGIKNGYARPDETFQLMEGEAQSGGCC